MEFTHYSVLLRECLEGLRIRPDGRYVDGTAGGAGHSREIAARLTGGRLYALDQDPDAVKVAAERLAGFPQAEVIQTNFCRMKEVLEARQALPVDGVLLDLGVSSWQLDNPSRGFSYREDAPLDMRMSQTGTTAADLLASLPEWEIARILWEYGKNDMPVRSPVISSGPGKRLRSKQHCSWSRSSRRRCRRLLKGTRIPASAPFRH